jgi:hypothetical protein
MATIGGTMKAVTYRGDPGEEIGRAEPRAFRKAFEIAERGGHYVPVSDDLPPGWEPADG